MEIMTNIQTIQHVADCVPLYLPHSLYLKPLAKLNISVALPVNKTGKSISNLDIMEKLSAALKPDKFFVIKVSKSTVEFIRFEAELEDRSRLRSAISRIDGFSLKVSGFSENFRVRASEPKDEFPTRYDWDTFFRDAGHMDEMKAGERPDTIHLTHLPIRWFCPRHSENDENVKPSESIFRRIFEKFGSVRCVDIPICDPYRNKMNSDINGMRTFSYEQDVLFEAYVQFDEYVGFVRAMDEFRGMKLVRKFVDKMQAINIVVNFDKTKHLSEAQLQRRERVRKRLIGKAKADEEEVEKQKKLEQERLERERNKEEQLKLAELEKQREREEKRKEKHLKKIQERGQVEISQKIRVEERKLMIAQRKLESIRILEQLFDRIKLKHMRKHSSSSHIHAAGSLDLRDRLVEKYKSATEKLLNEQRKKVEDIKSKTPLMGLLKSKKRKTSDVDSSDEDAKAAKASNSNTEPEVSANAAAAVSSLQMNPFKAVAALAAAGAGAPNPTAYASGDAASEWMKSLSMFPYVPSVFPGMSALYRPPAFPVSVNYRGFAPRMRARGRGRGRGRGGYDGQSSYYNNYKNYNYDDEDEDSSDGGYYRKYSRGRNRSRSRSRSRHYSRGRNRSRSRSRSRHYSRSRNRSRSRSRSRSRHSRRRSSSHSSRSRSRHSSRSRSRDRSYSKSRKSRSHSKTPQRNNKKLVSTRRSLSASPSRSRSHSRTRTKRSWSRTRRVVLETDKLVRSAEEIKRTIEKDTKERMREEEREIKENFSRRRHTSSASGRGNGGAIVTSSVNVTTSTDGGSDRKSRGSATEASTVNSPMADDGAEADRRSMRSENGLRSKRSTSRHNSSEREADAF